MENIEITTRIKNREMSAKEYINYCKGILMQLNNEIFKCNYIYTFEKDIPFYFGTNLEKLGVDNIFEVISVSDEDSFKNEDSESITLTEKSKSWIGFNSLFFFKNNLENENSDIILSISSLGAYKNDMFATLSIEFSKDYKKKITYEMLVSILNILENYLDIHYYVAYTDEFFDEVFSNRYKLWLGWITFLKGKEIESMLPENIICSKINDGYLFSFSVERVESNNIDVIKKTNLLRNKLGEKGLLNI